MKQIKLYLGALLSIILVACCIVMTAGCENGNVKKLKSEVRKANAMCPLNFGVYGDLLSVKYNEKENNVLFVYSLNEKLAGHSFIKKNKKNMEKAAKLLVASKSFDDIRKDILNAQASLTLVYKIPSNGKTASIVLSYDELKEMVKNPLSEREIKTMKIENAIEMENTACPREIEKGVVLNKVTLEEDYVVYSCSVDENMYDMDILGNNAVALKSSIHNELKECGNDFLMRNNFITMTELGYGIKYHYYGTKTDKYVDIKITPSELASMF